VLLIHNKVSNTIDLSRKRPHFCKFCTKNLYSFQKLTKMVRSKVHNLNVCKQKVLPSWLISNLYDIIQGWDQQLPRRVWTRRRPLGRHDRCVRHQLGGRLQCITIPYYKAYKMLVNLTTEALVTVTLKWWYIKMINEICVHVRLKKCYTYSWIVVLKK